MTGRDPQESHRASTPLELFFDLCFVVAVAAAAATLHHDLTLDHLDGLVGYAMVFFAIWWAWVNYSWFASAYDTDDIVFRLLTFVVMTGVLVVAAGTPRAAEDQDFGMLVVGYVIMRLAMVPLWLRVAREHPGARRTAQRYAVGITVIQALWILRTIFFGHDAIGLVSSSCSPCWRWRCPTGPSTSVKVRRGTGTTSPSATSCSRSSCSAR